MNCLLRSTKILQSFGKEGSIGSNGLALCNIQLVPGAVVVTQNNSADVTFDGHTAICIVTDNTGIGGCLTTGVIVVEPVVLPTGPGKGTLIALQILSGKAIYIGPCVVTGFDDKSIGRDGVGIEYRFLSLTSIFTGTVPGDGLAGL